MEEKVVAVEIPLVNEYGSGYGTLWLLFARTREDARAWIRQNLDAPDGTPYYEGRDVWNQIRVDVIAYEDDRRSPWWLLLEQFARKEIGPSALKRIARLADWWPEGDNG